MKLEAPKLLVPALLAVAACACGGQPAAAKAASMPPPPASPEMVVAELDGQKITLAEVDKKAGGALSAIRQQEYEVREHALDELLAERLVEKEARARGISADALVTAEVDGKVPPPSRDEVDAIYQQLQPQLGGRSRDEVVPQLERQLRQRGLAFRRVAFQSELKKKAAVRIALQPPRTELRLAANAPALGTAKAPVTIVEYLDYQCGFCKRAQGTVEEILARYGSRIRFVHRDFPIDGHSRAFPAAQAARCAGEQGKFWEYHRALFATPGDFGEEDLKKRASGLGLDTTSFSSCLASGRHDAEIRDAADSGNQAGVNSTPTFFVNGRRILGARPFEDFERAIEAELTESR